MEEKKYPQPFEAIAVILVTLATTFILFLFYPLYLTLTGQPEMDMGSAKYLYVVGALPSLIIPFAYAHLRKYDLNGLFRFKKVPSAVVLLSIIIGITMSVVGDEVDRLIQILIPTPEFLSDILTSMRADSTLDWIFLFLGVVIGAAFSEEIVYRGFLQVTLEKKGDVTRAVLLASLAWTILHGNPFWAVPIFIMGVIIGFLAWRTGSIIPGIIIHGINNFLSLLYYNMEDGLEWYTSGEHVSLVVLIPSLFVLVYTIMKVGEFYKPDQA